MISQYLGPSQKTIAALPADPKKLLLKRIAFGSCAEQDREQPIWKQIESTNPDLFLFIGDNIYADTEDMALMAEKYSKLGKISEFAAFRSKVPVLAVWDDHDYGINDGGKEYTRKEESKKLFLDFFNEDKESLRRKRPGIYTSYIFGPERQKVQLILLDLRWFRDEIKWSKEKDAYQANTDPSSTLLGKEQWKWLEEELKKDAQLRIIVSSIQFCSSQHPWEKWANFPHEKEKMLALIDKLELKNILLISGDMHFAELSAEKTPLKKIEIFDLTSSGMNLYEPGEHFKNDNRISVFDNSSNFGLIGLNWQNKSELAVSLEARNNEGKVVIEKRVFFDLKQA